MKEIYYTYNNEAIASCVILKVLQQVKTIEFARSYLILPILLDDRTIAYLLNNNDQTLTLENFITIQPRLFASFNKRFLALLPVCINSLLLLTKSKKIGIAKNISLKIEVQFDNENLGDRFIKINEALPSFLQMVEKYSTVQLYQLLKVQL